MIQGKELRQTRRANPTMTVNIITHSALGRYALQLHAEGLGQQLLTDHRGRPRYWSELGQMRRDLRGWGLAEVPLKVIVPQDEVIGRR